MCVLLAILLAKCISTYLNQNTITSLNIKNIPLMVPEQNGFSLRCCFISWKSQRLPSGG